MQDDRLDPARIAAAIVNSAADAVIASDRDGLIRLWNPGAERMFGYAAAQALGQSLDIIIPERLRARHWEGYRQTMATGRSRYGAGDLLAVPAIRQDGSALSVEFTIVPIAAPSGEIAGLVAVLRDVTARFEELKSLRRQVRATVAT
ncbi:MAG: PAS domain S-box protein [Microbacteriaceae bacterium]|nr:PAS domain S-box protein [Microbacteriaceae bacterium]